MSGTLCASYSMDKQCVLEFNGDLDIVVKDWIEREIGRIEYSEADTFNIIDLSRVNYLDTTFLNALMRIRNRLTKAQRLARICLVVPRSNFVRRIFEITDFDIYFPLFDDLPSARRSESVVLRPTLPLSA